MSSNRPRILLAAEGSGTGKTTITCGLLAALKNGWPMIKAHLTDGLFVSKDSLKLYACKCGPDYIDPLFHQKVLGISSDSLDLFFSGGKGVRKLLFRNSKEADLTVIEGVMGYYDGMKMDTTEGSTSHIASVLETPVILIVPARGKTMSVLAEIEGFLHFQQPTQIAGVFLNGVSKTTFESLKPLIEQRLHLPAVGYLPQDPSYSLASRHLGLVLPNEQAEIEGILGKLSQTLLETVDWQRLLEIASSASDLYIDSCEELKPFNRSFRLGIAQDEAFMFYYAETLRMMERMGFDIIPFSPLHDKALPRDLDGLYIGGGYPELYAEALSRNHRMLQEISEFSARKKVIAECGGFMYLHRTMTDLKGQSYRMAGVIDGTAFYSGKLSHFGYISVSPAERYDFWPGSMSVPAHEFHHWRSTSEGTGCLLAKPDGRTWTGMHVSVHLIAGFPHIYWPGAFDLLRLWIEDS